MKYQKIVNKTKLCKHCMNGSITDSGQVGLDVIFIYHLGATKTYLDVL